MTSPATDEIALWVAQYAEASDQLRTRSQEVVGSAWTGFTDWYDATAVSSIADQLAGVSTAAQQQVAGLAAQYVEMTMAATRPGPVRSRPPKTPAVRNGADLLRVYTRPAEVYRRTIATGGDEQTAIAAAVTRGEHLVDTDVMLAQRQASQAALEDAGAKLFRRILRPELSKSGSCGLCVVASDRIYKVRELMPIHDRCHCVVAGIVGGRDPGKAINAEDLQALYAAAGSTSGDDLKRVRVQVNEHGELGPVLTRHGDEFRAKKDVPLEKDPERAKRMLAATLPTLHKLEERAAAGDNVAEPLKYQRDLVARLHGIAGDLASAA
jgi:hypothetical protein